VNIKVLKLFGFFFFYSCFLLVPSTLIISCANSLDQMKINKQSSTAQNAIDAVFQKVKKEPKLSELINSFPKAVGSKKGNINVGGPPPGVKVVALFETVAVPVDQNAYEVNLIRRWREGVASDGALQSVFGDISKPRPSEENLQTLSTTWRFRVEANKNVQYLGRSGCDSFQYKVPQKNFCRLLK
jgi:hypothetical protein